MESPHDDGLPTLATRRRLLILQRVFFTFAIAFSIIYGGGVLRAALYHVFDNRAFDETLKAAARKPATTARQASAQTAAAPGPRSGPLARLDIPRVGLSVVVRDGTDEWTLNRGAGHIAGTSYPGSDGNIGIAGHRDGYFRALRDVHPADEILLTSSDGSIERYRVESATIVKPEDVSVLARRASPSLTLVTCYPFSYVGSAPKRYVLTASRMAQTPTMLPKG
jgi:LPXTG-site transpeptidase (sortase) family protein